MTHQPPSREGNLDIPFGTVVKQWREFRELSLTELAVRSGLQTGHLSEVETRDNPPRRETLRKLAFGLEVDEWTLYTRRLPDPRLGVAGGFVFAAPVRIPEDHARRRGAQLKRFSELVDEFRTVLDDLRSADEGDNGSSV